MSCVPNGDMLGDAKGPRTGTQCGGRQTLDENVSATSGQGSEPLRQNPYGPYSGGQNPLVAGGGESASKQIGV